MIYLSNKNSVSEIFSSKFLNISLIWNEGIAFGLFSFNQNILYNLMTLIIIVVILIILLMIFKNNGIKKYGLLMIFGGAIGNLYDRVFFKAVPDFIDFHISKNFIGLFLMWQIYLLLWE